MLVWDEDVRRQHRPRLFTRDQWHAFTDTQREVIRLQRMSWVDALELEHERRYHAQRHLIALRLALQEGPDEARP